MKSKILEKLKNFTAQKKGNQIKITPFSLFFLFLSLLLIVKISFLQSVTFILSTTNNFNLTEYLSNDLIIFLTTISLTYASFLNITPRKIGVILRIITTIILALFIVDILVVNTLFARLTTQDFLRYAPDTADFILKTFTDKILYLSIAAIIVLALIYLFISAKHTIKNSKATNIIFASAITLLSSISFIKSPPHNYSFLYQNYISYNLKNRSAKTEFSKDFLQNFSFQPKESCTKSQKDTPNIIILMVESLANYQSQYFSNINNWTPNLDKIAKENFSYLNFYANAKGTQGAVMAILSGKYPIDPPRPKSLNFSTIHDKSRSLPNILKNNGYKTSFMSASDISFDDTGAWLDSIGIDFKEGSESEFYKNEEKSVIKSVSDKSLYQNIIKRIGENNQNKFLIFAATINSHQPFIHPETKAKSEERTLRYVDEQIGVFYNNLKKINFFDSGILFITGDHHPMIPVKKEAFDVFGQKAISMVPLVMVYNKIKPFSTSNEFQQIDIYNTIKNLVGGQKCSSEFDGYLFDASTNPNYIFSGATTQRNIYNVFIKDKKYEIILDGDNTRIIDPKNLNGAEQQLIINRINFARISP